MMPDDDEKCQLRAPIVVLVPFTSPSRDKVLLESTLNSCHIWNSRASESRPEGS